MTKLISRVRLTEAAIAPSMEWFASVSYRSGLVGRLVVLACLFSVELLAISFQLNTSDLRGQTGLAGFIGDWGVQIIRALVASAAVFAAFAFTVNKNAFDRVSEELAGTPVSWTLFLGHGFAMLAFGVLSYFLFGHARADWPVDLVAGAWFGTGILAILLATFAFVPAKVALLIFGTNGLWIVTVLGGVLACVIGKLAQFGWASLTQLTFGLAGLLLRPLMPDLVIDPSTMMIGGDRFYVYVYPECSGFEGIGLMLIFSGLSLWFFRRESRFPQALLVIPAGMILMWLLNVLRIASLVLIGDSFSADVAINGFHSQAGWIAFSGAALGLTYALRHIPWLTTGGRQSVFADSAAENPTSWYLIPFLLCLATAMVEHATANKFGWISLFGFVAVGAALLNYRSRYLKLDWGFSWTWPLAGFAAFAAWFVWHWTGATSGNVIDGLTSSLHRGAIWFVFRVLSATVTLPIAEELAFRGFLLRRLISPDFERVAFHQLRLFSVVASSIAYGLVYGTSWLPAAVAGLLYAMAFRHRGRIGDAVAAHVTTNVFLSLWVLASGHAQL